MTNVSDDRVYITDVYDNEIEVYLSLLDEGIYIGVYMSGPSKGWEVELTSGQVKECRKLENDT